MHLSWDPKKDEEHRRRRGLGFAEVATILQGEYAIKTHPEYPDQMRTIGKIDRTYWTLVVEYHEDDLGELIWCSNFWKSTKEEKEYAITQGVL